MPKTTLKKQSQAACGPFLATPQCGLPEQGALFFRVGAKEATALTRREAEAVEGLLMLMASDDWKRYFVIGILGSFLVGARETPADLFNDLTAAVKEFAGDVEQARRIARDYGPLLASAAPVTEIYTEPQPAAPTSRAKLGAGKSTGTGAPQ
jgi:hypothetical protein